MTRCELFGIPVGQVLDFHQVFVQVVEIPDIQVKIRFPVVEGDRLPAFLPDASLAPDVLGGAACMSSHWHHKFPYRGRSRWWAGRPLVHNRQAPDLFRHVRLSRYVTQGCGEASRNFNGI